MVIYGVFFIILFASPTLAWNVQTGSLGEIKICRVSKPIDDGVIMVEMSELFQGIAIFSKTAASLELKNSKKYGYRVEIWSDENPRTVTFAWKDLRGILVPLTIGRWVNEWEYVVKGNMLNGEELKLDFGEDNSTPNQPTLSVPLEGFNTAFSEFISCIKRQWNAN